MKQPYTVLGTVQKPDSFDDFHVDDVQNIYDCNRMPHAQGSATAISLAETHCRPASYPQVKACFRPLRPQLKRKLPVRPSGADMSQPHTALAQLLPKRKVQRFTKILQPGLSRLAAMQRTGPARIIVTSVEGV